MNNLHPIFDNIFKTTYPKGVFKTPTKKEIEDENKKGWGIPDETRDATDMDEPYENELDEPYENETDN